MNVTKAVIPAAGLGTRMSPLTRAVPKELLPVGNLPMIHYAIFDAIAAGLKEIYVVINKERKAGIEEFYSGAEWRNLWPKTHSENLTEKGDLVFLNQEQPNGIFAAVEKASPNISDEPFFLIMPDNVYFGKRLLSAQLKNCFEEYNQNTVGLIEVRQRDSSTFGNAGEVQVKQLQEEIYSIVEMQDKGKGAFQVGETGKAIRTCGWYIFKPEFFVEAEQIAKSALQIQDEVPIVQRLIKSKRMLGVLVEGRIFDCGNWDGYWAANRYWMRDKEECN